MQIAHLNYSLLNTFQEQLTILMKVTINSALLRNCTSTNHEHDYTAAFREAQQGMSAVVGQQPRIKAVQAWMSFVTAAVYILNFLVLSYFRHKINISTQQPFNNGIFPH